MEGDSDSAQSGPHSAEEDARGSDCDFRDLEKELAISNACIESDISALKALAESEGGFLTDELRRRACSCLSPRCLQPISEQVANAWHG